MTRSNLCPDPLSREERRKAEGLWGGDVDDRLEGSAGLVKGHGAIVFYRCVNYLDGQDGCGNRR